MRSASAPAYRIPVEAKRQAVALLQQYEGGQGVHLEDPLLTGTVHFIVFESGRQTPDVLAILQQIPGSRVPESTKPGHFETSMQNRRRAMEKNPTLPWHYGKCSPDCPPGCQGKTSKRARSAAAGGAEGPPSTRPALAAGGVVRAANSGGPGGPTGPLRTPSRTPGTLIRDSLKPTESPPGGPLILVPGTFGTFG
jgi:hypothetical protein